MIIFNTVTIDRYDDATGEVMWLLASRLEHTYCFSIIGIDKTYVLLFNKKHFIYTYIYICRFCGSWTDTFQLFATYFYELSFHDIYIFMKTQFIKIRCEKLKCVCSKTTEPTYCFLNTNAVNIFCPLNGEQNP